MMKLLSVAILWAGLLLGLTGGARLLGQQRETHPVTGREYAPVMSHRGADWLEREEREREEHVTAAIRALDLQPGMMVADIGAGTGYFARRMAKHIAPGGKVYAVDIQPEMLDLLKQYSVQEKVSNVVPVLAKADDPGLPMGAIDLAIMVDVYHELSSPRAVLRQLAKALKPDGRLVLLEYREEDPKVPILPLHKMSVEGVKQELAADGFVLDRLLAHLPRQHMLIFKKQTAGSIPAHFDEF